MKKISIELTEHEIRYILAGLEPFHEQGNELFSELFKKFQKLFHKSLEL